MGGSEKRTQSRNLKLNIKKNECFFSCNKGFGSSEEFDVKVAFTSQCLTL